MAEQPKRDVRNHVLFEVATEVANRVGGIYSVLKSKAQVTTAEYGSTYTLLGPLNRASAPSLPIIRNCSFMDCINSQPRVIAQEAVRGFSIKWGGPNTTLGCSARVVRRRRQGSATWS